MRLFARCRYVYVEALPYLYQGRPYQPRLCAQEPRPVSCADGYGDWLVESGVYLVTSQFFNMSKIITRIQGSTPKFFKILRNIGVTLAAVSAAVFASPVDLPTIVIDAAGYLAVAGSVMGAVSQTAVLNEDE
jgi:hypothetical protein